MAQALCRLAMTDDTGIAAVAIGLGRAGHEFETVGGQLVGCILDGIGAHGDMLDALAAVTLEVIHDLAGIIFGFGEWDPDLAARRSDGAADYAGEAPVAVRFCHQHAAGA